MGPSKAFVRLFMSISVAGSEMEQGFQLCNLATNLEIPLLDPKKRFKAYL